MNPSLPGPQTASPAITRPFQFGVRSLLLAVAAACALLAAAARVGPTWTMVIFWLGLLAAAHVFGTALGTRLRDDRRGTVEENDPGTGDALSADRTLRFAPATRLCGRHALGNTTWLVTSIAACLGGVAGTLALATMHLHEAGYPGVVLGGLSTAVIGGFLGFLSSSFCGVWSRAIREASGLRLRRKRNGRG